jgi:hypothetical protein
MLPRDGECVERREGSSVSPHVRSEFRAYSPVNFAVGPSVGSMPVKNSKLPVCTASA